MAQLGNGPAEEYDSAEDAYKALAAEFAKRPADLPAALAAEFTPTELRLIGGYLTRRAVEARATSRADEAAALRRLGDAVAAAQVSESLDESGS